MQEMPKMWKRSEIKAIVDTALAVLLRRPGNRDKPEIEPGVPSLITNQDKLFVVNAVIKCLENVTVYNAIRLVYAEDEEQAKEKFNKHIYGTFQFPISGMEVSVNEVIR